MSKIEETSTTDVLLTRPPNGLWRSGQSRTRGSQSRGLNDFGKEIRTKQDGQGEGGSQDCGFRQMFFMIAP